MLIIYQPIKYFKFILPYKGRTIRKVMGGGRGIFEPQESFFVIKFLA